jgi:predicted enzyme related to lactoylglutathione lyase
MARIVHFEIPTDNPEKSLEFYKNTFGWNCQQWGEHDYWLAETGKEDQPGINGAIMKRKENMQTVVNTIHIDDIEKTIAEIGSNGGEVVTPVMDIPNIGKVAYFKDPDGNMLGVIQYTK